MATEDERDLGFGSVVTRQSRRRLLNRDGSFNIERRGLRRRESLSPYHAVLEMTWTGFLGSLVAAYLLINVLFAAAYLACGPGALGTPPSGDPEGRFLQAFFFSVETFATIGYGQIYPVGIAANAIMVVEALLGLLGVALATGIIFARFSRPSARIRFSRVAVVAPYRGISAFMFRVVNQRRNQIVELDAKVVLSRFITTGGTATRRFDDLALERRRVTFFPLAWTIVHPIDETSPLHGATPAQLAAEEAEFLVLLSGVDDTFSQMVHARSSYHAAEIVWGARFGEMFNPPTPDGVLSIDIRRLDDVRDAADATPAARPAS